MSTLVRFLLNDGASIVANCEPSAVSRRKTRSSAGEGESDESSVTFVSDGDVERIPAWRLRAMLPIESPFQIPTESTVYRFAIIT